MKILCQMQSTKFAFCIPGYIYYISMSPNPNRLVFPTTANLLPIWTPVYSKDLVAMTREINSELTSPDIPHLQRGIFRRGDEEARVC